MKAINAGAASCISNEAASAKGATTSKIVDQALHVVKARNNNNNKKESMLRAYLSPAAGATDASQSSHDTCNNHSVSTNTTAASTIASSVASGSANGTPMASPLRPSDDHTNYVASKSAAIVEKEPNCIAPALRKIAKKRRKEPDRNGMERSSFHHTKSSKEYLRKAQEALRQQQQEPGVDQMSFREPPPSSSSNDNTSNDLHDPSPRTNFRRRSCLTSSVARGNIDPVPFSTKQGGETQAAAAAAASSSNNDNPYGYEDPDAPSATSSNPYGYEDPDARTTATATKSNSSTSNPYGYEDPDAAASTQIIPAARRMGPARRRGSVTKYSLQAAQAAQKATERIMRLQGLNWNGGSGGSDSGGTSNNKNCGGNSSGARFRSATPTGRRRHARRSMGMSTAPAPPPEPPTAEEKQTLPIEMPVRRRSIPLEDWDNLSSAMDEMDTTDLSGHGQEPTTQDAAPKVPSNSTTDSACSNLYGYENPDTASSATAGHPPSNPYGYENPDSQPRPQQRRHPAARRRGSVTKYSLEAAKATIASETENAVPASQSKPVSMLKGSDDFVMALKPPAAGRSMGQGPKGRRRSSSADGVNLDGTEGGQHFNRPNSAHGSDHYTPRRSAPRRTGSHRSASSRHLSRFGGPTRSDSFISHGSAASFEDDADSLAPDMESLCSIHDRLDSGMDLPPVPPPPSMSPITPGVTPGSVRKSASENRKSFSERGLHSDFAILPFPAFGGESRSSSRMPAPPVRRTPSGSSASDRPRVPGSILAVCPAGGAAGGQGSSTLSRSASFSG